MSDLRRFKRQWLITYCIVAAGIGIASILHWLRKDKD